MSAPQDESLKYYYRDAASWSADRSRREATSRKIAWIVAAAATLVALFEGIALLVLMPLKTVVPYTILVDRHTGHVQELAPTTKQAIIPDDALARSLLAQYVGARESYDVSTLQADYRKVALWSAGEARDRYIASMQASNPLSPLATLPRQSIVATEVLSVSSLSQDTALVRFRTVRSDPGTKADQAQHWVAVVKFRFSSAAMTEADRWLNPLGFQVLRYRRSAEVAPASPQPATTDGRLQVRAVP